MSKTIKLDDAAQRKARLEGFQTQEEHDTFYANIDKPKGARDGKRPKGKTPRAQVPPLPLLALMG
jgi:hypothetical protein